MARRHVRYDGIVKPSLRRNRWWYRVRDPIVGTYRGKLFLPLPEDDGRTTPGTAAGDRWAAEQRAAVLLGRSIAAKSTAVPTAALVVRFAQEMEDRRRKPEHVAEVRRVLSLFAEQVPDLAAPMAAEQIRAWRSGLRTLTASVGDGPGAGRRRRLKAHELAPTTLNRYLVHVRSLLTYAVAEELLPRAPGLRALHPVDEPDQVKPILTVQELRAVLALDRRQNPTWRWVVLMAYTGCRPGEAQVLRAQDVNRATGHVEVRLREGVRVKRDKERDIPIQPQLLVELDQWPTMGGTLAGFSKDVDRRTRGDHFADLLKAAGVDHGERTPHSLRHGFAAMLLATREDVIRLRRAMGHSDLKLTDHYSREMNQVRAVIESEGWKPGELRLRTTA